MISYKELVNKTMPKEKRGSACKDLLGFYVLRPIENVISIPFIELKVVATNVTIFSFFVALLAIPAFVIPGKLGFWLGWGLIFLWNLCDGIDGNIARYTDTCSARGELWDATAGWIATMSFYFGMGMVAFYEPGMEIGIPSYIYIIMGSFTAIFWIFPRTVMHKKAGIYGQEAVKELKGRSKYGILRLILFNITSINGFAALLFLLSYILKINSVCMLLYFALGGMACAGSLYSLLRKESI